MTYEYENMRRLIYGDDNDGEGGNACFVPVCEKCNRFVKADDLIKVSEFTGLSKEPNATCSKCGRTHMIFEGFI